MATKLKGDYRTGKRINMRKIIPYIARYVGMGRKGGDEGGGGYLMPNFTKWSGDSRSANASCWSASRLLVTLGFTGLLVS